MKSFKLKPLIAVLGGTALAISASSAIAGIANTKHNLTVSSAYSPGAAGNYQSAGTAEICVFCHTPHGASTDTTGAGDPFAPLWNKGLSQMKSNVYTLYSSNTLDASFATDGRGSNTANANAVGSVSLACLSCHDGTQAMDNMINAPGFGNYNSVGARLNTYAAAEAWSGPRVNTTTGTLCNTATTTAMLGTNLADDHPIGIAYCASTDNWSNATSFTCGDKDFNIPTSKVINGVRRFWVDTNFSQAITVSGGGISTATTVTVGGVLGTRERTDIMLYNRQISSTAVIGTVECASCHDPHVESKQNNQGSQVAFLRVSQAGSGVCLACHAK